MSELLQPAPRGHGVVDLEALARVVTDPDGFLASERGGAREVASYELRQSGLRVFLRHGSSDIGVLEEVFVRRLYDPPAPVAAALAARAQARLRARRRYRCWTCCRCSTPATCSRWTWRAALLADSRFAAAPVTAAVLEFHPRGCPGAEPCSAAEELLADAGYTTSLGFDGRDGVGVLWAWRRAG